MGVSISIDFFDITCYNFNQIVLRKGVIMKGDGSVGFVFGGVAVVLLLLFVVNVLPKLLADSK